MGELEHKGNFSDSTEWYTRLTGRTDSCSKFQHQCHRVGIPQDMEASFDQSRSANLAPVSRWIQGAV